MNIITIKQPWAYLICHGIKDIENRTWRCPQKYIGERILIHAGAKPDNIKLEVEGQASTKEIEMFSALNFAEENNLFGCIIGSIEIVNCVINHSSIWAEKTPYIVELEEGVYLSNGTGDPARTLLINSALNFKTRGEAHTAMLRATEYRSFKYAKVIQGKPIYNWVLANPLLFKNPIENVKGKLSFWETDLENDTCIDCDLLCSIVINGYANQYVPNFCNHK